MLFSICTLQLFSPFQITSHDVRFSLSADLQLYVFVCCVPEADIAPAQHYVLITGDQVVFYEVYAFLKTS